MSTEPRIVGSFGFAHIAAAILRNADAFSTGVNLRTMARTQARRLRGGKAPHSPRPEMQWTKRARGYGSRQRRNPGGEGCTAEIRSLEPGIAPTKRSA